MTEQPTKEVAYILQLQWRRGTFATPTTETRRFTDLDSSIDLNDGFPIALSDTSMQVALAPRTASLAEAPDRVTLGLQDTSLISIAQGYAFQKITATVTKLEYDSSATLAPSMKVSTVASGRVIRAKLNPGGKDNLIELHIQNCKSDLSIPSGRILTPQCDLTFGGPICGVDVASLIVDATMVNVSGVNVTVTELGLGTVTDNPRHYWAQGAVYLDGLSIKIRKWEGSLDFQLAQLPPESWTAGTPQVVELVPGCRKTVADCRVFNNEDRFSGLGISIPDRHPIFERGTPV